MTLIESKDGCLIIQTCLAHFQESFIQCSHFLKKQFGSRSDLNADTDSEKSHSGKQDFFLHFERKLKNIHVHFYMFYQKSKQYIIYKKSANIDYFFKLQTIYIYQTTKILMFFKLSKSTEFARVIVLTRKKHTTLYLARRKKDK